ALTAEPPRDSQRARHGANVHLRAPRGGDGHRQRHGLRRLELNDDTEVGDAMKTLQVLGMGCQKCQVLTDRAEEAARALGLEYTLEKVSDLDAIVDSGVMATPALVVDGEIKVAGRVPTVDALKTMLA